MRIAIVDESASRAAVIREGLAAVEGCEIFVVTERRGLVARIGEIAPDIVLMDLGNPSRDVLEEYFAVSRVLGRPIAMFVDESDEESIAASVDAGVSSYVVDGLAPGSPRSEVGARPEGPPNSQSVSTLVRGILNYSHLLPDAAWLYCGLRLI